MRILQKKLGTNSPKLDVSTQKSNKFRSHFKFSHKIKENDKRYNKLNNNVCIDTNHRINIHSFRIQKENETIGTTIQDNIAVYCYKCELQPKTKINCIFGWKFVLKIKLVFFFFCVHLFLNCCAVKQ